jgi:hypothetical protein
LHPPCGSRGVLLNFLSGAAAYSSYWHVPAADLTVVNALEVIMSLFCRALWGGGGVEGGAGQGDRPTVSLVGWHIQAALPAGCHGSMFGFVGAFF